MRTRERRYIQNRKAGQVAVKQAQTVINNRTHSKAIEVIFALKDVTMEIQKVTTAISNLCDLLTKKSLAVEACDYNQN